MAESWQLAAAPAGAAGVGRLGKNANGYLGETIAIAPVLEDCLAAARAHGWTTAELAAAPQRILAFHRPAPAAGPSPSRAASPCIYLSTGIHGDEPAGPLAARQLLQEDTWPPNASLWFCPCLNPGGFQCNRRENAAGLDLNRQFREPRALETVVHTDWLRRQPPFDLCLCLHEDWEAHGFYLYELNPDARPSLARAILAAVEAICPVDLSEVIEGRPADRGVIRPNLDPLVRPDWPEALFLLSCKTRLSYTLEAPSDFPLKLRVSALVAAVNAAVRSFAG